jgi:hypothetical protein
VMVLKGSSLFGDFTGGSDPPVDPPPSTYRGWPF